MEKEFINKLDSDEKILFHGFLDASKTSKQYGRFILGACVLLLFWILFITSIRNYNILSFKVLVNFAVLIILTICLFYGVIYNIFLKHKVIDNEYFVTNKRVALYNLKIGFRIENIFDIERIGIVREKGNYGDILFTFYSNGLADQIKNRISFEGVENPRDIVAVLCDINSEIYVYDDKPVLTIKNR